MILQHSCSLSLSRRNDPYVDSKWKNCHMLEMQVMEQWGFYIP